MSSSNINDLERATLQNLTGLSIKNISQLEYAWLIGELGISPAHSRALPGLWKDYFISQGIAPASIITMADNWLTGLGYTGSLQGKWASMWAAGGPFLPSSLSGLKLWTRFNMGITITGSGVSQWDDQSGNGNHLKQGTDTNRPSKEVDGSILFDAIDNFLKADAFTLVQPETIYVLGKQVTWANDYLFDGHLTNSGALFQSSSTPNIRLYAGVSTGLNSNLILDTYSVISSIFNGVSSTIKINDTAEITGNAGTAGMGGFTLGARGDGLVSHSNIQVKEVIIYNTAHDDETRAKVITYLQTL